MADIKITDLVDEKVFEDLEKLSENLKSVKQQYIDAAKELAQGLNMKITTSGDLEKLNNAVAESSKKAQHATEQLNTTIDRQREIIGQTTNTISRELAEIEKANKAKRDAFAQDKSALEIAESIIGTRNGNIRLLAQYQAELKAVKEAQKNLDTAIKSGTVSEGAAAKQMAANLEKQRTLKASIQDLNNVLNNQDKQMQAANGSYQKLSLQLEFLKKAYKSLNEEEKSSAIGQKLADEISNMDAHLKDLAADMGEFQRNTGNYAIANQSVKKELRELIQEIATLTLQYRAMSDEEKGSAAGQELEAKMNALKARASELKDAVSDVNREIQSGANDTQTFSAITEGINVVISGVGGLTAASHALGIGEKDLIKIQTSLQASLAASNALVRAQTALQAESNLMKGFDIDSLQAEYVAEIKLRNINRQYILNRTADRENLEKEIKDLEDILKKPERLDALIIKALENVAKTYGQERKSELLRAEEAETFNVSNMIEDYRLKLFLSDHGYIKKIALTSLRNAGDLKIKEDDEIVMELEGTNKSEILFFSDKANCYKMKAFELPDTKPSEYGGYLPNVLQMEEGEKIIFMHVADDFKGNVLFSFENGKISKIPMSAYETKQNRKKLIHAYSDISPIVCIRYITEDVDMAAFSNLRKAIVFNSSLIPLKTTRSSQGVQVLTSKKGSVMTEVKRVEETDFTDPEYYRVRRLPAIGYYLKEETIEDRQLTLGDL